VPSKVSVERELLEELRNVCGDPNLAEEVRVVLCAKEHPIIKCLHDKGEIITLRATIVQQSKLIDYLNHQLNKENTNV
jgi:hypothetical protein